MQVQTKFHRINFGGQSFCNAKPLGLLPDRVVPLKTILTQFLTGRPIDESLNKNLPYNDVEYNPLYRKGVDLADLPKIAKEVGTTLQQASEEIEQSKLQTGASQIANPSVNPPEQVQTD